MTELLPTIKHQKDCSNNAKIKRRLHLKRTKIVNSTDLEMIYVLIDNHISRLTQYKQSNQ
jgi:hypothetical protein